MAVPDATRHARPRPWHHHPPAPSAAPGLYTSVVLRRSVAYLVDVVIIAVLGLALGFVLSLIGLLSFGLLRSEEHTTELQSLMRISYDVFCLKKKINIHTSSK